MYNKEEYICSTFGVSPKSVRLIEETEKELEKQFERIDKIAEYNQL